MGHRGDMEVGNVADVDDGNRDIGHGVGTVSDQGLNQFDRCREVLAEDRAEDAAGVDDSQLGVCGFGVDEVPRGAFGEQLGLDVGVDIGAVDVGPVVLGELTVARRWP